MGITLATAILVGSIIGGTTAAVGIGLSAREASKARRAAQQQSAALTSLAPPPPIAGPTASEAETQKAKESADKRAAEREKVIATQTAADIATRRRSLTGLSATIRTSPFGLTGPATTEKKTLLGQGGLR